ncbi:oxidoreductase [Nannochloropsis oceanica]
MLPSTTSAPTTTVRWGIIGCGDVVEVKSGPAFNKVPNSCLKAVMRRNGDLAKSFAQRHHVPLFFSDPQQLLDCEQVDAVYIATPPGNHKELALLCATMGKPTLVEKPMARCAVECREMIRGFNRVSLPLFVAYYRRHLPKFEAVHTILKEGKLGKITEVRLFCSRLRPMPKERGEGRKEEWRVDAAVAGGGLFLDLGSHMLDLVDWLFGPVPLESVKGMAGCTRSCSSISRNSISSSRSNGHSTSSSSSFSSSSTPKNRTAADVEDQVRMVFRTKEGALGMGSWNFASSIEEDSFVIVGEKGHVKFSVFNNGPIVLTTRKEGKDDAEKGMVVETIGGFDVKASPHVHLPLIAAVTDDVRRWKEAKKAAATAKTKCDVSIIKDKNGDEEEKEEKEEIEWQCRSTGASALRTSEVMDKVLVAYYGGTRDDAFWTRPETWDMPI